MRKTIPVLLVLSLLWLSGSLYAEKKGAEIIIEKNDGQQVSGELIAVKQNSLLLLERKKRADVSVDIKDVSDVVIIKTPKTKLGAISGLIIGVASGTYIGYRVGWRTSTGAIWGGVIGGLIGVLAGGIIGSQINRSETFQFAGKSDTSLRWILAELRKKARVPDFQ
jgi:hypothetical protein